jgi:hypothetical protein
MTALMTLDAWVKATDENYLADFIREGGASVKFAIAMEGESTSRLQSAITTAAANQGYMTASVDAAATKISAIEQVVYAITDQLDFGPMIDQLIMTLAGRIPYQVPSSFDSSPVQRQIADYNDTGVEIVSVELRKLLQNELMKNTLLTRDLKIAMTQLALARLNGGDQYPVVLEVVSAWLGGRIQALRQLKDYLIHAKVVKANARSVFASLLTTISLAGLPGLVVTLDISQLMATEKNPEKLNYTKSALLDAYEVLREFIDATDDLENFLLVVTAPQSFLDLEPAGRGIGRYQALRARVYDEVRDRNLANPMSALIRVSAGANEVNS